LRIEHLFDTVIDPDALSGSDHSGDESRNGSDVEEWVVGECGSGGVILRVDS
jgi:hypothetical protein